VTLVKDIREGNYDLAPIGIVTRKQHLVFSLLNVSGVNANFFVIFLQSRQILPGLREFTLLHTLTDVPVDKGTLGVKEVELVVKATPGRRDGSCVGQHAHAARDLGKITARDVSRRLIADTKLETCRAPVDELNGTLSLDDGDGGIDILGDNIAAVQKSTGH